MQMIANNKFLPVKFDVMLNFKYDEYQEGRYKSLFMSATRNDLLNASGP